MDRNAFKKFSYGLYIITVNNNSHYAGCVVNTVTQITSIDDPIISVSINKNNYTNEMLKQSKKIAINILTNKISQETITKFGFYSSREVDKFTNDNYDLINDLPILKEGICAYLIGDVIDIVETTTHDIFLIKINSAKVVSEDEPLTYEYYQKNMKGMTHKNAPTYIEQTTSSTHHVYRCIICGYIYDDSKEAIPFVELPSDWVCPSCGVTKDKFERIK